MKKQIILITLALMVALCATACSLKFGSIKGNCHGPVRAPIADANVVYQSAESGRKYEVKTDKKGEYFSLGIEIGKYKVTLTQDGPRGLGQQFSRGRVTRSPLISIRRRASRGRRAEWAYLPSN